MHYKAHVKCLNVLMIFAILRQPTSSRNDILIGILALFIIILIRILIFGTNNGRFKPIFDANFGKHL